MSPKMNSPKKEFPKASPNRADAIGTQLAGAIAVGVLACVACVAPHTSGALHPSTPTAEIELSEPTQVAKKMIQAFSQGDAGNCASIGVIKAALHEYGDEIVADRVVKEDGGLEVRMRDGVTVSLTSSERAMAATLSHFKKGNDDAVLEKANELFVLMAKRLQAKSSLSSIVLAATELNSGMYFLHTPELLGVSGDVIKISGRFLRRWFNKTSFVRGNSSCVAASKGHAWFVSHGFADGHGSVKRFNSLFSSWYSIKAGNAYCLVRKQALP